MRLEVSTSRVQHVLDTIEDDQARVNSIRARAENCINLDDRENREHAVDNEWYGGG
jgi:hypothetical protein